MTDSTTVTPRPLRLVIAGGGTGGHVLPAVAVVEEIRRRDLPVELLWIGGHTGVERDIARANDIPFTAIQTGKLRRYFALRTFTDLGRIPLGIAQAFAKLRAFRPDVIFGTGGAVSFPTVFAGSRLAPVLTHEQTAQIGVSNRMASRFADVFAVAFEETAKLARARHGHVVVTGNPTRSSILGGSREVGLRRYGFSSGLPVLYITGGAQGATPINRRLEPLLPVLLEDVQILHQAGPPAAENDDVRHMRDLRSTWPETLRDRYHVDEFIHEGIADVYAMTSLVLARAGAGTVAELARLGLPSILIPLPGTWGDEQRKNAELLADASGAVVLKQSEATPERLRDTILKLVRDPEGLSAMGTAARSIGSPDAASHLLDEILKLASRPAGEPAPTP